MSRSPELQSSLGRYLLETGTSQRWLAEQLGVNPVKVCRWASGASSISHEDRLAILHVLAERNRRPIGDIFMDVPYPGERAGSGGTPFDRALRRAE